MYMLRVHRNGLDRRGEAKKAYVAEPQAEEVLKRTAIEI